jgi:hypothetical protein
MDHRQPTQPPCATDLGGRREGIARPVGEVAGYDEQTLTVLANGSPVIIRIKDIEAVGIVTG